MQLSRRGRRDEGERERERTQNGAACPSPQRSLMEGWELDARRKREALEHEWAQQRPILEAAMAARCHSLRAQIAEATELEEKTRCMVQLKKLKTLQLQRRLRRELMDDLYRPPLEALVALTARGVPKGSKKSKQQRSKGLERWTAKQKEERQRRLKEKHREFFKEVEQQGCVREFHKRKERAHRERLEKLQREKISLLKANDVEGYLRMVKDVKSDRVQQLLKETEAYLHKLGAKLSTQKLSVTSSSSSSSTIAPPPPPGTAPSGEATAALPPAGSQAGQNYLQSNETYYTLAHSIKEHVQEQPRLLEGGTLREYQLNGLRWLLSLHNNQLNGILADEMGLGKTVQVISLLCYLMETKGIQGPFLIVVPSSVLPNWVAELTRWAPKVSKVAYCGSPEERRRIFRAEVAPLQFNVLITTYDFLMSKSDRPRLSRVRWQYLIIDEGHRIKNAACKLNADLKHYASAYRLLLTGTPIQNNLDELWTLLNFLLPSIFCSSDDFAQWFSKPFEGVNDGAPDQALLTEEENLLVINRLHQVLRPFMLRRLKERVESELPEKVEHLVRCEASAYQRTLMRLVAQKLPLTSQSRAKAVHNTVMELRNICNHPFLSHLHSIELEALDRILPKLKAGGHRVLFFCTMTRLLDVMEEYLDWKAWPYLRLDGSTGGSERGSLIADFNDPSSPTFIFLL
eukprot:jgi/Mesen1/5421/ME000269S04551